MSWFDCTRRLQFDYLWPCRSLDSFSFYSRYPPVKTSMLLLAHGFLGLYYLPNPRQMPVGIMAGQQEAGAAIEEGVLYGNVRCRPSTFWKFCYSQVRFVIAVFKYPVLYKFIIIFFVCVRVLGVCSSLCAESRWSDLSMSSKCVEGTF